MRRITLVIAAGACLLPFGFAPVAVTVICFAIGGLVHGPFVPLTHALFRSATSEANLRARSSLAMLPSLLGAGTRLLLSGAATIALAVAITWTRQPEAPAPALAAG